MGLIKRLAKLRIPRWSTVVPFIFYSVFILLILSVTFPLKSLRLLTTKQESKLSGADNRNEINNVKAPEAIILSDPKVDGTNLVTNAFHKADKNQDNVLSLQELARYINARVRSHIENAIMQNPIKFRRVDLSPRDGLISWEEYHAHFLREHGLPEDYILKHNEDKHIGLDRKSKEAIMRDKALWTEAARTDPFSLTLDEFLAFQHPESSAANLLSLVDDLLRQFDVDGDENLTVEEFATTEANQELVRSWTGQEIEKPSKAVEKERREEFKYLIDKNKNGKADRGELLAYVDPQHPRHSLQEAAVLFNLADNNKDSRLSLDEVLAHIKIFITSKMISTAESFHDEF